MTGPFGYREKNSEDPAAAFRRGKEAARSHPVKSWGLDQRERMSGSPQIHNREVRDSPNV